MALVTTAPTPASEVQPSLTNCDAWTSVRGGAALMVNSPVPGLVVGTEAAGWLEQAARVAPKTPKTSRAATCFAMWMVDTVGVSQIADSDAADCLSSKRRSMTLSRSYGLHPGSAPSG